MRSLNLTEEEATLLEEVLGNWLSELRMEIMDTDSPKFKEMLKGRKALIAGVKEKLGAGLAKAAN